MVGVLRQSALAPDEAALKTLGTGVILMLCLLPMLRSAALALGCGPASLMVVTLIMESSLSVGMLFGKMRCRRARAERRLAETITRAVRQGV